MPANGKIWDVSSPFFAENWHKGGAKMKEDEKKPNPWEAVDPKVPVIRSGHFENRRQNDSNDKQDYVN